MAVFKTLWGNNGDFLSMQYAGHISDMREENLVGRNDVIDRYNSVFNMFGENVLHERFKNQCINILLQEDIRSNILYNQLNFSSKSFNISRRGFKMSQVPIF